MRLSLLCGLAIGCSTSSSGGPAGGDDAAIVSDAPDFAELNTPVVCTSGTQWTGGDRRSSKMHPGASCIECHTSNFGPGLTIAGTVFPSAHEPDDCNGAGGLQVVVTGADGVSTTLSTNSAGNFYSQTAVALPFSAKVVSGTGSVRTMLATQTNGDCDSCHTQDGTTGAPGRIVAP